MTFMLNPNLQLSAIRRWELWERLGHKKSTLMDGINALKIHSLGSKLLSLHVKTQSISPL